MTALRLLVDVINPGAGPDQYLCEGDTTQLFGTGGTAYLWSPATSINDPSIANVGVSGCNY
jgi:hypothetical protein